VSPAVITRAQAAQQGIALTRATQTLQLSRRGEERYDRVSMADLRFSRPFRFGSRSIAPQIDIFNIMNSATPTTNTLAVGASYLAPVEILSPRIARIGVVFNF